MEIRYTDTIEEVDELVIEHCGEPEDYYSPTFARSLLGEQLELFGGESSPTRKIETA